jgi:hypothetical protein
MPIAIFVTAMIVGAIAFIQLRSAKARSPYGSKRERRLGSGGNSPFHAVSIKPSDEGCLAVASISSQRFLSEEAPGLPLAECSFKDCTCKYIHHADRRDGARDRRVDLAKKSDESEFWRLRNRRIEGGRRQEDRRVA